MCAAARSEEDKNTGAILKCLVTSVDALSANCARETGRAVRNALQFYQPKAPVTDVCDSDIAALCLGSQGLNQFGIGQVCLLAPPARRTQISHPQPTFYVCLQSFSYVLLCSATSF